MKIIHKQDITYVIMEEEDKKEDDDAEVCGR